MKFYQSIVLIISSFILLSGVTQAIEPSIAGSRTVARFPAETTCNAPREQVVIKSDGFEGDFPNEWQRFTPQGWSDVYWGDVNCQAANGSWSCWCADEGNDAPADECTYYVENMQTWMVYGPFDLSDAVDGGWEFYYGLDIENQYDYLFAGVSVDGSQFYGYTMDQSSANWEYAGISFRSAGELGDVTGSPYVWIGYMFSSNASYVAGQGAYVDDVTVWKEVGSVQGFVSVVMPMTYFVPDDLFYTDVTFSMPQDGYQLPLYVILDVWGFYYFAPYFNDFGYYSVYPTTYPQTISVISPFYWPYGAGWGSGLRWWAAMLDPSSSYLMSNLVELSFSFGEW